MLQVSLFGKPQVSCNDETFGGCDSVKAQELFCYLLLHRDRPHAREMLASLLWGDYGTTSQSKKYLSKALWQLRGMLGKDPDLVEGELLQAESDWIQLCSTTALWLDVAVFESAYVANKGVPGADLDEGSMHALEEAVQLYRGCLLENWYHEWCLYERERFHEIYLLMLDKLMGYCETHHRYEAGLFYGERILRYDRARERTHRQLMRLYYRAGDRTGALRQYARCAEALKEELDVEPARSTSTLYEQIRADQFDLPVGAGIAGPAVYEVLTCLEQLQSDLSCMQQQVEAALKMTEAQLQHTSPGA